jgi:hypothetical protein
MKKVLFFVALAAFASSCKKDKTTADVTTSFKKNLVAVETPGQSEWTMFYANDHKLLSFANNDMSVIYKPGIPFSARKTMSGNLHEYKNAVQDAQGRVVKLDRYVSGLLTSKQEFKYNADGYLSEQIITAVNSNTFAKYIYEYQAGNLVSMSAYEGGSKTASVMFEYFTNQLNPIRIDLFDFKSIEFVTDAQFGKQSKNLVKTGKLLTGSGQLYYEINMSYMTDADGYIKTMTHTFTGQAPKTYTCSFQ